MSTINAKDVSTYQRFYDEIVIKPGNTPLLLYYLILSNNSEHFDQFDFSPSQFCKYVRSGNATWWKNNIACFALVTPVNF